MQASGLIRGICILSVALLVQSTVSSRAASDQTQAVLSEEEARARFQEIIPKDVWFRDIPWRSRVCEALWDAQHQDKPIFLLQMRGHPLGST